MVRSENENREQRILDAAADLIVHFGYDKTTVGDIAREAGISKGAIYLHFSSKASLFEALLVRELQRYVEHWLALMEEDPQGGTIAGLYKNSLYALSGSPFMTAIFKQDRRILGTYLRQPDNFFRTFRGEQAESDRYVFVKMMQEAGAMREDLDPRVVAHVMDMLAYGLVGMDEVFPVETAPPLDDIIEGIAEIMDRALSPNNGGDSEAGKEIIRKIAEAGRLQYAAMGNPIQE